MQFAITTDYAIRCVLYLAIKNGCANSLEISTEMGVPQNYAQQILGTLRRAGLVKSLLGGKGGYALVKTPDEIRLLDIIELFEKTVRINRCLEDDHYCSRNGVENNCTVRKYYTVLQSQIDTYLYGITIRGLMG